MSETRRRRRKNARINNTLLIILIVTMVLMIAAFIFNMNRVRNVETGEGETIEETMVPDNEYANRYYSIGYNATEINKQYFRELDDAVEEEEAAASQPASEETAEETQPEEGEASEVTEETEEAPAPARDNARIAQSVVKCFITEYYTWTNKDGNYDIGGMQYVFSDRRKDFETYTRYNFYADMDLYLTQYDRSQLIQVRDVTINSVTQTDAFTPVNNDVWYDCYAVDASWSYEEGSVMDTASIQNHALFLVVNHDGRLEIAAIDREEVVSDEFSW